VHYVVRGLSKTTERTVLKVWWLMVCDKPPFSNEDDQKSTITALNVNAAYTKPCICRMGA